MSVQMTTHQVDDVAEVDLDRTRLRLLALGVMDQLADVALSHLVRLEAEDEEQRVDRVALARAVGSDDGAEGLVSVSTARILDLAAPSGCSWPQERTVSEARTL